MIQLATIYGQRDPRWRDNKLGSSGVTIGGYGCAVTSLAMLITHTGKATTPLELDEWLTSHFGYSNGNLVNWGTIDKFTPNLRFMGVTVGTNLYPCIAEVDLIPTNSKFDQHFVVDLGDGMCADPWEGRVRPLSDFKGFKSHRMYEIIHNSTPPVAGGNMDNALFKDAFLRLALLFNDHYDESWNNDQKKVWLQEKERRLTDAIKASQNPPTSTPTIIELSEALHLAGNIAKTKGL